MKGSLGAAALFLAVSVAVCEVVVYSSAYGYDYPTTTLLNLTNIDDQVYQITPPFDIRFQAASYNRFYVSSNSFVAFGNYSSPNWNYNAPAVLIDF